mmetsp:Transcript_51040/g.81512  ORF Transcript_51040/g.81512 Transcript_51040/m.81512 type:complete len:138 (+) Transcript_51040:818-1231(+)
MVVSTATVLLRSRVLPQAMLSSCESSVKPCSSQGGPLRSSRLKLFKVQVKPAAMGVNHRRLALQESVLQFDGHDHLQIQADRVRTMIEAMCRCKLHGQIDAKVSIKKDTFWFHSTPAFQIARKQQQFMSQVLDLMQP